MSSSMSRDSTDHAPRPQHELNVTPMLDVLLVLLVIFMAAAVAMRHTMDAQLPEPCQVLCNGPGDPLVLEVLPGSRFLLNKYEVRASELASYLRGVFAPRPEKILHVRL
jgi:biopolymer transport protein ExbD